MKKSILILLAGCLVALSPSAQAAQLSYQPSLEKLDLPQGWYLGEIPAIAYGPEDKQGGRPLYVFNRGAHALLAFSAEGAFVREIGAGLFSNPHGMRVDNDGNIWTTDLGTHQVLKFAPDGKLLMVFGKRGTAGPGWFDRDYNQLFFNKPNDVAFDVEGNIYVADGGNFRIVKFSAEGDLMKVWGKKGTEKGSFNFPHSLIVGKDNRLYVADRENQRIQIFSLDGMFEEVWDGFGYPYLIDYAVAGGFWVTDARADRLLRLSDQGKVIGMIGASGKRPGTFGFLHGVAEHADGHLLVSDILNWRIQRLTPKGRKSYP